MEPQRYAVVREPLTTQLAHAMARGTVVVVAPAGYGKSMAVLHAQASTSFAWAWHTLSPADHDPVHLARTLVAAINAVVPTPLPQATRACAQPSHGDVPEALLHDLAALPRPLGLVLDDWVAGTHQPVLDTLITPVLDRLPHIHLVIISRSEPRLPDGQRQRVAGRVRWYTTADLRFGVADVQAVLTQQYGTTWDPALVAPLVEQTGGWIAAMLLAVESGTPPAHLGTTPRVYRYLVEQIIEQVAPSVLALLLPTSLMLSVDPAICQRWLGFDAPYAALATLEAMHLITPDPAGTSWQYQPLFRSVVQHYFARIAPHRVQQVLATLTDAAVRQQQWHAAWHYAVQAGDDAGQRRVFDQASAALYARGESATLRAWINALSPPPANQTALRVYLAHGDLHQARPLVALLDPHSSSDDALLLAQWHRTQGAYAAAITAAQWAYDQATNPTQQISAQRMLGTCLHRSGALHHAYATLSTALQHAGTTGIALPYVAQLQHDLGMVLKSLGRLAAADAAYAQAATLWDQVGNPGMQAMVHNSRGVIAWISGRFADATAQLTVAQTLIQATGQARYAAAIAASWGDLYADLGQSDAAAQAYMQAQSGHASALTMRDARLGQARLSIWQGHLREAAVQLAAPLVDGTHPAVQIEQARLAVAQGAVPQAHALLADLDPTTLAVVDAARYAVVRALCAPGTASWWINQATQGATVALAHREYARGTRPAAPHSVAISTMAAVVPVVTVRALDTAQVLVHEQMVLDGHDKLVELLVYMLLHPQGSSSRTMRAALWEDAAPEQAQSAVQSALARLRRVGRAAGVELVVRRDGQYLVDRARTALTLDIESLLTPTVLAPAHLLAQPLRSGVVLPRCQSAWVQQVQAKLDDQRHWVLTHSILQAEAATAWAAAHHGYACLVAFDPSDQHAQHGLLTCLLAQHQRDAARQQAAQIRRHLHQEGSAPYGALARLLDELT